MHKIISREACDNLIELISQRKARVVKEGGAGGTGYFVFSASGSPIGQIGKRYEYMFEAAMLKYGSNDGLFINSSQTTRI